MKKDSILKALGITFAVIVLLSWVIPAGSYSNGTFTSLESTLPIGLYDFVRVPVLTIATFIQYGLLFLAIGGFYGVLNKTGVYSNIINSIVKKCKNKKLFLIITVICFALVTSLTGLTEVMFLLVPFFVAILLKLGYNKLVAFTSTVGAIFVGNIGSTLGFNVWGYFKNYLSLDMTTLILARIILLVMMVALLVIALLKITKNDKKAKEETIEIPLFEENKSKKSALPLIIISILLFVLLVIGGYNWYYSFEIETFTNLYESISTMEIAGRTWVKDIFALGNTPVLGFFQNYDITIILVFVSLIIGWVYNVKMKDIVSGFAKGAKEMLLPATYAVLACIAYACVLNMGGSSFVTTIINKFVNAESFSFMGTVGTGLVGSFVYNDLSTLLETISTIFTSYDANVIPVVAFIIQGMFGLVSLIAPTSVYLLAGLSLCDISYKEWIRHIWKFALILFGIIIVVAFILTTII
ncbi:MAG: hypothetical protein J6B98_00780 [Bacilli bacterium]|nr:hypothetical protein [Bacilli bacterium]